jgi:topoisomerase-4 subunit A
VLLNIDEVIRIIRNADEPKPALIERFAERPPGRGHPRDPAAPAGAAGGIKIEQELAELRKSRASCDELLGSPAALKRTLARRSRPTPRSSATSGAR